MKGRYRTWEERREIFRSIISDSNPRPLVEFQLTHSEEIYYRARSAKAIAKLAKDSSAFKAYYDLPTAKPFAYVIGISMLTSGGALAFGIFLLVMHQHGHRIPYTLLATCATVAVAALGWAVAGWNTHRNTVRQNTNNILFARFSQAPFGEALHRFHKEFGWKVSEPVTTERITQLRESGNEEKQKAAASAVYILNYFESIASGVLHGDLDKKIVSDNVRGLICSYHDKCSPHIMTSNKKNRKTYENMIKLRTHYREP
jgi:hypothetical protein